MAEAVVIGGGFAGLTAASILSHNGVEVELLESTGHLGGRAAFDRKDGFLVEYGIHLNRLAGEGAAAAALREIGHEIDFLSTGEGTLFLNGEFVPLPTDVAGFLKTKLLSATDKTLMVGDLIRLVLANPVKKADVPLRDLVWGANRERLAPLLEILSFISLVCPDISLASAGDFAAFAKRALKARENVGYLRGGTTQIIEVQEKKINENGKVSLNSRVKSIQVMEGKVTGVLVRDETHKGKVYVFAAPLQGLPGVLQGISESFSEKCSSIVPTAGISMDLCLRSRVSDIDGLLVTTEPLAMGQFTSNIDCSVAPEGKQLATFYRALPAQMMEDREAVDSEVEKLKAGVEKMFPGIMDKTEWERVLKLKMVDGFEPRVGQTAKDRPGVAVPGVENLFLAGDAVSAPGSGGDVAFTTGVEAARAALAYLK